MNGIGRLPLSLGPIVQISLGHSPSHLANFDILIFGLKLYAPLNVVVLYGVFGNTS